MDVDEEEIREGFLKYRTKGMRPDELLLSTYAEELMKYKEGKPSMIDKINIQDQLLLAPPDVQKIVFLVMKFMQMLINRHMSNEEFLRGMNTLLESFVESYGQK